MYSFTKQHLNELERSAWQRPTDVDSRMANLCGHRAVIGFESPETNGAIAP